MTKQEKVSNGIGCQVFVRFNRPQQKEEKSFHAMIEGKLARGQRTEQQLIEQAINLINSSEVLNQ